MSCEYRVFPSHDASTWRTETELPWRHDAYPSLVLAVSSRHWRRRHVATVMWRGSDRRRHKVRVDWRHQVTHQSFHDVSMTLAPAWCSPCHHGIDAVVMSRLWHDVEAIVDVIRCESTDVIRWLQVIHARHWWRNRQHDQQWHHSPTSLHGVGALGCLQYTLVRRTIYERLKRRS